MSVFAEPVAVQAAPSDAPVFWPTRTRRQRGVVADLADAMTSGPFAPVRWRARCSCASCSRCPMLVWLAAIVLIGRSGDFPLRIAPIAFFAMQGGAERRSLGGEPNGVRHRRASGRGSARRGV